ncbi:MAG: 3'(2'),5'-bisphosphate nucleotidase CysQ [Xanthomonadales bacterium]|nr:3'(2'),5'-bisphosphate nucleotidase CysQ [Xanthomonadales bacterium]
MAGPAVSLPSELGRALLAIAEAAGRAILAVYEGDFAVERKADDSPLTQADLAAHRVILAGLAELEPAIPVLSEESAAVPWRERAAWRRLFLVDPLDGTREFVKRNGEFTVNLALIEDGRPVLGVVHAPALGLGMIGEPGRGAHLREGEGWRRLATRAAPPEPVVAGSRSHRDPLEHQMLARIGPHRRLPLGSSLKLCRIAEGVVDLYLRQGPTSEWDTAAGQAIVEAAGGAVVDLAGEPLRYNRRESLRNPPFLACGDPGRRWWELLR